MFLKFYILSDIRLKCSWIKKFVWSSNLKLRDTCKRNYKFMTAQHFHTIKMQKTRVKKQEYVSMTVLINIHFINLHTNQKVALNFLCACSVHWKNLIMIWRLNLTIKLGIQHIQIVCQCVHFKNISRYSVIIFEMAFYKKVCSLCKTVLFIVSMYSHAFYIKFYICHQSIVWATTRNVVSI